MYDAEEIGTAKGSNGDKVLVISHAAIANVLTAQWSSDTDFTDGPLALPDNYIYLDNMQLLNADSYFDII
jgi:hypothetical protein